MLQSKSFLAVDFGAANLKLAEFEVSEAGGLWLKQYGLKSLGQDGLQESTREPAMLRSLQELLSEKSFGSKNANVCAPGFNTFSKFVKLPPVDTSKVTQIIQYEAQQNVPFPLEEVVWDYQILGATPTGELEVLLVAIKSDVVEGLFRVVEKGGLRLQLVDVSPAALCNAFRYNYGDLEGCTMLLDIGAKTSNLIFFEAGNVYSRGINIGANTITQDFSRESRLGYTEAEGLKINEGFVSLGGAYEEPDNQNQAAISKIARQVMTRLHIQVNQTVQYYRGQQGGSAPERLFLSGGASVMPYTAQFFAEKLNVPVDYFNPLRNVELDPSLDREELVKVAHSLGEVVGLGLRNLAHCPVEMNLMPASSLRKRELSQKKPYIIASICSLILVLFVFGLFYQNVAREKEEALSQLEEKVVPLRRNESQLRRIMGDLRKVQAETAQFTAWMEDRFYWARLLTELRQLLIQVEQQKEQELSKASGKTVKTGLWIERFEPADERGPLRIGAPSLQGDNNPRPHPPPPPNRFVNPNPKPPAGRGTAEQKPDVTRINLFCRGVSLSAVAPDANNKLAYGLLDALKGRSDLVETNGTEFFGKISEAEDRLTFTFQITTKLKRPFKF
jgi:type IV pilus assembly protein PilM